VSGTSKSNNIVYKIIRFLYENFIVILPVLVGLNLLFQNIGSNDLTIYLYDVAEKGKLYESKFEVYNEGNPISKHELIQPLIINLQKDNAIVDFDLIAKNPQAIKIWFSKLTKNKLKVDFDLLNESENITFSMLTSKRIENFTVSSRIKGVEEVVTYHYQIKPKYYDRIGKFWIFLLLFSIVTFIDASVVVSKNKQLKRILNLIDDLSETSDKELFLEVYRVEYSAYKIRFKRNKETIIADISLLFDMIATNNLKEVKLKMNAATKRSVLYTLRKPYLLISPVLFLISLLVIIGSIIFYSTF